jgi:Putative auto-transporter adhesin, head GIN domain
MKNAGLALAIFLGVAALALVAAGTSAAEHEARALDGFTGVEVRGGVDLKLRQGAAFGVEVSAPNGEAGDIATVVENGTLIIEPKRTPSWFSGWFSGWFGGYSATVTLPRLESLHASGGSDVTAEGVFAGDRLAIDASGGSDVAIDVNVGELVLRASGASDMRLEGTAGSLDATTSGASDLNAFGLEIGEARINASGASDSTLNVTKKLVGHASGASDVYYKGNPPAVDVQASGASDVVHR